MASNWQCMIIAAPLKRNEQQTVCVRVYFTDKFVYCIHVEEKYAEIFTGKAFLSTVKFLFSFGH